ncbi:MAG: MBL fold metallo-hydrolase [Alicyclobacillus sp.]|nr:MBL fold metallo-hydrolase [Alicyclobacillus sp.]
MRLERFVVSAIGSNCYVLAEDPAVGNDAVIIDPGDVRLEEVFAYIEANQLQVRAVWATHAHFDHVLGVDVVRNRYHVPAWVHAADLPVWQDVHRAAQQWLGLQAEPLAPPDRLWQDGDVVRIGSETFTIWHTPGHSPGSVCLVNPAIAFTGDTLFAGTIGRTDLPLSDPDAMRRSLLRVRDLPDSATLYPGHGQETTITRELHANPFLQDVGR